MNLGRNSKKGFDFLNDRITRVWLVLLMLDVRSVEWNGRFALDFRSCVKVIDFRNDHMVLLVRGRARVDRLASTARARLFNRNFGLGTYPPRFVLFVRGRNSNWRLVSGKSTKVAQYRFVITVL